MKYLLIVPITFLIVYIFYKITKLLLELIDKFIKQ